MPTNQLAHNYKPSSAEKKAGKYQGDPTIVFDTFVVVGRRDAVIVHWPDAMLSPEDRLTLVQLSHHLTTLGRAEGWVQAALVEQPTIDWNCVPSGAADALQEQVSVFCPDPVTAFGDEYYPPPPDAKKLKKGLKPGEYLFDCPRWHLCLDTEILQSERWPRVPGARWVSYSRPANAFTETSERLSEKPARHHQPTVARFLVDGPVLPLVTETVRVAEAFRRAVMSQFGAWCRKHSPTRVERFRRTDRPDRYASPILSGKGADGRPRLDHDHAYYLPTAENDPVRIDRLTVFAAKGLGPDEVAALAAVRLLEREEGDPLQVRLSGLGRVEDFPGGVFGPARAWESATPFVVTRHVKKRGRKKDPSECYGLEGRKIFAGRVLAEEIERWLDRQSTFVIGKPPGHAVRESLERPGTIRPLQFRRARQKLGDDGASRQTGAFRVEFDHEVWGPLCVGHASHFGLGLFLPAGRHA
jgi:CRISPR-associated protein Csb2